MGVGSQVRDVIESQGETWQKVLQGTRRLDLPGSILCVGSGTSYYLAMVMAHIGNAVGIPMQAAPSQDVVLEPDLTLRAHQSVIVLSRSGETSEANWTAAVSKKYGKTVLGITCNESSELAEHVHHLWAIPEAHDHTVVMIRSFTSMLMAFQSAVVHSVMGDINADRVLENIVSAADEFILQSRAKIAELLRIPPRRTYILGSGVRYGIALEGALKALEMSNENAYAYGPLEFRHGPWGSVTEEDLIVLLGQRSYTSHEQALVNDLSQRTSQLLIIAHHKWFDEFSIAEERRVEIPVAGNDMWFGPMAVIPLQWIGWHWATNTQRNPDVPRALEAAVNLDYGV